MEPKTDIESAPGNILTNHDFVKLWAGETVSLIGTQVTLFALPLVAILTLQASVFQVGLLNASRYAPVVIFSLFAGVWLDRRRRRPILIACSLGNGFLIGLVPLASVFDVLSMNLLYVICFLVGVLTVVFDVGVLTYVPSLVERRHLPESNGRIQTSTSLAGIVGPGLAGLLVGILTAPITLAVDAVSYLCSAIGLISIRKPESIPDSPDVRPSVRSSIAEGLRAVYGSPLLRSLLTQSATFNFFQNGLITIFMVYAIRDLRLSPFQLGIVIGAIAVGGLGGAMFANRIRQTFGLGRTMMATTITAALCPLVLLIPRDASLTSLAIMIGAEVVYGFSVLAFNVNTITLRQLVTPNRLLGRMNASYRLVLFGTGPLGAILGGLLGQAVGLRDALVIAAIALTSPIIWTLFSPVFRLKEMPTGPDEVDALPGPRPEAADVAATDDYVPQVGGGDDTGHDFAQRSSVRLKNGQNS
jgi:MFS family permease